MTKRNHQVKIRVHNDTRRNLYFSEQRHYNIEGKLAMIELYIRERQRKKWWQVWR